MPDRTWTVREVIEWSAGDFKARNIESARLDAELLVAQALGIDRIGLYLDLERPLVDEERAAVRTLVTRRRAREPVAYILGHRDFYGRRFLVNHSVLIPRPDTEVLVERALEQIPVDETRAVLDVGTGSGAVALTLAAERPLATVTATDLSASALEVARSNAEAMELLERVEFQEADIVNDAGTYDLVVSNPPYVTRGEHEALEPEVRDHEPELALVAGEDGLDVIRRLLSECLPVTRRKGELLVEVGAGQADAVRRLVDERDAWEFVDTYDDLQGIARVVHLRRT
ncbi:MAG: peptide chain release factor N(5)-glutamine methyltransferase [Myxococcota bacterium]